VEWLDAYLVRAGRAGYITGDSEAKDLTAVGRLLRSCEVPMAGDSAG
jgi:hypothetical protein